MIKDIRFDFERSERIGFVEAIYGESKSIEQLKEISKAIEIGKKIKKKVKVTS